MIQLRWANAYKWNFHDIMAVCVDIIITVHFDTVHRHSYPQNNTFNLLLFLLFSIVLSWFGCAFYFSQTNKTKSKNH